MDTMFFNFVMSVICGALAFYHGYHTKNIAFMTMDAVCAIINLPYAIKWLISIF